MNTQVGVFGKNIDYLSHLITKILVKKDSFRKILLFKQFLTQIWKFQLTMQCRRQEKKYRLMKNEHFVKIFSPKVHFIHILPKCQQLSRENNNTKEKTVILYVAVSSTLLLFSIKLCN